MWKIMTKVTVYSTPTCPWCHKLKDYLKEKKVEFADIDVAADQEKAKEMGVDVYELLNKEVAAAEPGARGLFVVPHFAGAGAPHWDPNAKGLIYGLSLGHNKRDILRAIIEGVCFEVKRSLDVFSELGVKIQELNISGGATRAEIWNQIQAYIFGVPVIKSAFEETTALFAAILACVGTNTFRSINDAVENLVTLKSNFEPRAKLKEFYEQRFEKYKKLYKGPL